MELNNGQLVTLKFIYGGEVELREEIGQQDAPGPEAALEEEDAQVDHHHHHERPGEWEPDERLEPDRGADNVSCAISKQSRLPTPKVWASPGGSCPRTLNIITPTNLDNVEEQPVPKPRREDAKDAKMGTREGEQEEGGQPVPKPMGEDARDAKMSTREKEQEEGEQAEGMTWVKGAEEEENVRYRKFLNYCEERRQELRARIEEDEERLKEAKRKEGTWELMRASISFERKGRSVEDKEDRGV